jgi:DNA-binding transcriptional MerR regulator
MTTDQVFTISEAARATGKSIPTIHTYLKAGKLPNATSVPKGKSRSWQIPLTDLVASGLLDKVVSQPEPEPTQAILLQLQTTQERLALAELELKLIRESLDEYKERELSNKALIKTFTNILETRQTQEARRAWWQLKAKQAEPKPTWTPEQD